MVSSARTQDSQTPDVLIFCGDEKCRHMPSIRPRPRVLPAGAAKGEQRACGVLQAGVPPRPQLIPRCRECVIRCRVPRRQKAVTGREPGLTEAKG